MAARAVPVAARAVAARAVAVAAGQGGGSQGGGGLVVRVLRETDDPICRVYSEVRFDTSILRPPPRRVLAPPV